MRMNLCIPSSSQICSGVEVTRRRFSTLVVVCCACTLPMLCIALPQDGEQPIHIKSKAAEFDQLKEQAVYQGDVELRQGTLVVTGEHLTVDYRGAELLRISATGRPARYRQMLDDANGPVRANAATIIYHPRQERIDFQGSARLVQAGNTVDGEFIHYDIVSKAVDAQATQQRPVRVTLQPGQPPPAGDGG